jgi:hypothetical protein
MVPSLRMPLAVGPSTNRSSYGGFHLHTPARRLREGGGEGGDEGGGGEGGDESGGGEGGGAGGAPPSHSPTRARSRTRRT